MKIKKWFFLKEFTTSERIAIEGHTNNFKIERETEKAVLVKWYTDFGMIKHWVPKACIE